MKDDVIVIGAGLSGLAAAALLAKRGLRVTVVDSGHGPGGSCGIFKRGDAVFDKGTSMLFGFGERGFNAHAFLFNCLEEPISMIRHDALCCIQYEGQRIIFWPDMGRFVEELSRAFPGQKANIRRFYRDMARLYRHIMVARPVFATPDETDLHSTLAQIIRHPISYARYLGLMNRSAHWLLKRYFTNREILGFFNKLMSTYGCATAEETPALIAAVMLIDNHIGGSYYPAGSTLMLPGLLEKVIEEHGGRMLPGRRVKGIIFDGERPAGVTLETGERLQAHHIIYSGTVWNLYGGLLPRDRVSPALAQWAADQQATASCVVLYACVDRGVIPAGTLPVEMLADGPGPAAQDDVTVFIPSLDDYTLCPPKAHVVTAIGPSLRAWSDEPAVYAAQKAEEQRRMLALLERRFPGFAGAVQSMEFATPRTIERFTQKNGGAMAGPKQRIGQHLLRRQHTRTPWPGLYCCGESTVMGTGTSAVTVSGISAANAVLRAAGLPVYAYKQGMKPYVTLVEKPFTRDQLYAGAARSQAAVMAMAARCLLCLDPDCSRDGGLDVRSIMRRVIVGNLAGARRLAQAYYDTEENPSPCLWQMQCRCIQNQQDDMPVPIREVVEYLMDLH